MRSILAVIIVLFVNAAFADDQNLTLLAWNVETQGSDVNVIADQLRELRGHSIYGLTQVNPTSAVQLRLALGDNYGVANSVAGNGRQTLVLYDKSRIRLLNTLEPKGYKGFRMNDEHVSNSSPFIAHFADSRLGNFLVVLVNLARTDADLRRDQARSLRSWCADQQLPVIGLGSFYFDVDIGSQRGNAAFQQFFVRDLWQWVKPNSLIDTHWLDEDLDGKDDHVDICQDFVMAGSIARKWPITSTTVIRKGDFPDDESTSSHRPIAATVHVDRITTQFTPEF